jgi:hypothetical protein
MVKGVAVPQLVPWAFEYNEKLINTRNKNPFIGCSMIFKFLSELKKVFRGTDFMILDFHEA